MKTFRILLALAVILSLSGCSSKSDEFTVMKGLFRQSFTETGELEAISSVAILMPRIRWEYGYEFKIVELTETGKLVKARDTVIRIDPSSIEKVIITTQEKLDGERAASKKLQVQMDNNIQELKAQLRTEQAMFDLKKLELERSKFDTEKNRKIKELDFKQATIRMDKINRQLAQKPVMDNYDFRIQKIKEKQVEAELAGAKEVLGQMFVTCPIDGMFQAGNSQNYYPPRSLKVGDRAYTGMMIAKIPDINHMKVRTYVNETDITKVSMGMPVLVRLDALPELAFHGKITELSRICTAREKEMIFKVVVEIQESDLRLKPGMTVSCEYICNETDNALYVPNSCLYKEDGKSYVFLKKGGVAGKTEVKAGPSNSHHTLIYSGIEPGVPLVPFETVLNKI
ncbi:MAG: efflux RND transporter periplasmic adaptor subunit [Bacteroidales bacterium]|jgi:multidrug efflux pump subunit AcrA (membrane-fusion protein)